MKGSNIDDPDQFFEWTLLNIYPTSSAAEIDAAYLRSEGIPATAIPISDFPGQVHGVRLLVSSPMRERAAWLLKFPPASEAELNYLSTGEFPKPTDSE